MRINLIPLAGRGTRFAEVGYTLPKPLIPVSGKPMIVNVIEHAPPCDQWIFVVLEEHVRDFHINKLLLQTVPNAKIIIDKNPVGQATTCLLAREFIKDDDELFITACDNTCLINEEKYNALRADPSVDAVIWTWTERDILREKPQSYGWHELEADGKTIKRVSVKVPVSSDPFHDHAVVATFLFKKAKDFMAAADNMITKGDRTKNEFYVDTIPNYLNELGKRSVIFDVDLFICWGTPAEFYEYQYMEYVSRFGGTKLSAEQQRLLTLWKRYFRV